MLIKDLFSHKIHSTHDNWADKLVELAFIFSAFDNKPFDRKAIEKTLSKISPRASIVARDKSKFRDEISAYPAYLGLYRVELVDHIWHLFLSNTAKQFLVCEEPNVPAFMMLQMALFQYPNGMGIAYTSNSGNVRIQANTCGRTLDFIKHGVHLSPLRLICKGLLADAKIKQCDPLDAKITFDEIFILANHPSTRENASPQLECVEKILISARKKELLPPSSYESRFHILKHTNFVLANKKFVQLRAASSEEDRAELLQKFDAINSLSVEFTAFDSAKNSQDLVNEIKACSWGRYFDGVSTLDANTVNALTSENFISALAPKQKHEAPIEKQKFSFASKIYALRKRSDSNPSRQNIISDKKKFFIDPEITKIRRQRSNLNHKILLQFLHEYLEGLGAEPQENEHIDLFVQLPSKDKFIFEVKSVAEDNLLSQTRKGISQLYEYRFRYQDIIGYDVNLCLVFPHEPVQVPWLQEYLCTDRKISIIWFTPDGQLAHSSFCKALIGPLAQGAQG